MTDLNLHPEAGYLDEGFAVFSQPLQANADIVILD
jgi:hypothetical protein